MDCEAVDWILFALTVALLVAVVALYAFIIPSYVVLLGAAAQCAAQDPCGRFGMFALSMLVSFFMGFVVSSLLERDKDKGNVKED